jgi:hypothetical protein
MLITKKFGLAGATASIAVAGALLASGSAGAASQVSKASSVPTVVGAFVAVAPGQNGIATVACPAGTLLTGGGGQTSGIKIFVTDSYQSGQTWTFRGTNTNTVSESIRASAVCLGVS